MAPRPLLIGLLLASAAPGLAMPDAAVGVVADERWASGVPLGGIGCGHIELLTDGGVGGVTINSNWDRPTGWLRGALAAIRVVGADGKPAARLLRLGGGDEYTGVANVRHVLFRGLWPEAQVEYKDDALPGVVTLRAWSCLIPRNADDSALPAAVFDFTIPGGPRERSVALAMAWPNILGFGGGGGESWESCEGNVQRPWQRGSLVGLRYTTSQTWPGRRQNTLGDYVLAADAAAFGDPAVSRDVEVLPSWDAAAETPAWWRAFADRGSLDMPTPGWEQPAGAVLVHLRVPARAEAARQRFVLAWFTPHLVTEQTRQTERPTLSERDDAVGAATDGGLASRWTTGRPQRPGELFELTLAAPASISGVVLDSTPAPNDWPRGLRVSASEDGEIWHTLAEVTEEQAAKTQRGGRLEVRFEPARAAALRLEQLGRTDFWWWSIHELRLLGADGKPLALRGAKAKAFLRDVGAETVSEDVGHFYERRFHSAGDVADYVATNADRLWARTDEWRQAVLASSLPRWLQVKLINDAFSMYAATVLTRDGRFAVLESPVDMRGALGTMDQRMAAHALYTQMFPELDESELRLFAGCQQGDGRITHFCGNVHEAIGRPDVGYGVTDWPDLSCSFILQTVKLSLWRGDRKLLADFWPHIQAALAWLDAADTDGDLIPEGGSTYDYESVPRGAFVYSASCYLGALLAGEKAALTLGDADAARAYRERFQAVQASVMERLWNGSFFRKWASPKGERIENSFVAALAGDWLALLTGLGDTLPAGVAEAECRQLQARHVEPFYPVPPMEVTPDGFLHTHSCFLLQHEPYLGCEMIYRGIVGEGMEVLRRCFETVWEVNRDPWHERLAYDAPSGFGGGLRSYMTCPASWHVLNALSGVSADMMAGTLYVSPRLWPGAEELKVPVFMADWWGLLEWTPGRRLTVTVTKVFRPDMVVRQVAPDGNAAPTALPQPVTLAPGTRLDLTPFERALKPVRQIAGGRP